MNQYHYNQEELQNRENPRNYTNSYTYEPGHTYPPPTSPSAKKRGGGKKFLAGVALVLACGVSGFGGSYFAYQHFAQENTSQAAVSEATEQNQITPVGNASDLSVSGIAAKALPSVVSITTENMVSNSFLGGQIVKGAGSGVIVNNDGTIVTNHHVINGASSVSVLLHDGREYNATVLGSDQRTDVAVIKIEAEDLVPATIGDSDSLTVGEFCIAIGNPMGTLGGTVTDGIISALDREMTIGDQAMSLLQMSAAVSPGNSGGGLFNEKGELIGIVNAKSDGDNAEGLGFSIPVNIAMGVADQIITQGRVTGRPALGVSVAVIGTEAEAMSVGLEKPGVYVQVVNDRGAADKAGIEVGDRIVSLEGKEVETTADLSRALESYASGDTVTLVVEREKTEIEIPVTLQELEG